MPGYRKPCILPGKRGSRWANPSGGCGSPRRWWRRCRSRCGRLLRWRDEGREVRDLDEEYPEAYDEQRNEDLEPGDHLVELGAQSYPYYQDGRHERNHNQRHEVVGEARRRSVEPRRQLDPDDFEHADEVS